MATTEPETGAEHTTDAPPRELGHGPRAWIARIPRIPGLLMHTLKDARDDRIIGVAAEIAFFALLAIPPMLLVLAGSAGYVGDLLGEGTRASMRNAVIEGLGGFLAPETMDETVRPTVEALFERGRGGLISLGALLAIWSASRLIKVLIEAMNIAYDVEEWRSAWRRRLLAVGLTFGGLLALAVAFPFIVAGPNLGATLDDRYGLGGVIGPAWRVLYWPGAVAVGLSILTTLYHVAPNWQTPWRRDLPGAMLAAGVWLGAAFGLRLYVDVGFSETEFGPLAAPVVLLLWLYVSALAVLLGAELNAEIEKMWPTPESQPKEGGAAARIGGRARDLAAAGMQRITTRLGRRRTGETAPDGEEDHGADTTTGP